MTVCTYGLTIDMGFVYAAMGVGFGAIAFVFGIAYMAGKVFDNPRLTTWARDELPQLFLTVLFTLLILSILNIGISIPVGELSAITPFSVPNETANLCAYDFAENYLENATTYVHNTLKLTRIHLYMADLISSMWKDTYADCADNDTCDPVCKRQPLRCGVCSLGLDCFAYNSFFGRGTGGGTSGWPSGWEFFGNVAALWLYFNYCIGVDIGLSYIPGAWVRMLSSVLSAQMHSTFAAIIMLIAQKYLLASFLNGGFIAIIPLGLILRSIPFMRRIGGILLGIGVGFIVIFPLFLVIEGLIFTPWIMWGFENQDAVDYITGPGGLHVDETDPYFHGKLPEWELLIYGQFDYFFTQKDGKIYLCKNIPPWPSPACSVPIDTLLAYGAVSFLLSSFLLSLNFIGTAAGIVGIGKFFGEEIEIARFLRLM